MRHDGYTIRSIMRDAGVTVNSIADKLGVTNACVGQVIHGRRPNPRIKEAIAAAVNMPVAELWPDETPKQNQQEAA